MRTSESRRGGVLAAFLIAGVVILCIAIASALFVARSVQIRSAENGDNKDVSIETPVGHLEVHAHEKALWASDVPIYPGAHPREDNGGNATVEWTSNTGKSDKGFSVSGSEMTTPDPVSKVVDFYKTQLPAWIIVKENDGGVRLELKEGGYRRFVGIQGKSDGTHIGVASVGEPASN